MVQSKKLRPSRLIHDRTRLKGSDDARGDLDQAHSKENLIAFVEIAFISILSRRLKRPIASDRRPRPVHRLAPVVV
jgi:hypothetical protein